VRQAYDDFAMPLRLAVFLAIGPLAAIAVARRRWTAVAAAALASIGAAELGRRRAGGTERFPFSGSLLAPTWIAERAVCSWLALGARAKGGVRYGEGRLRHPATPMRRLRRRYEAGQVPSEDSPVGPPAAESPPAVGMPLSARKPIVL
jgi:hypothetical protein